MLCGLQAVVKLTKVLNFIDVSNVGGGASRRQKTCLKC